MNRAGPLDAYVLHQWDWSETSLIVDLFSREAGRVAVAAKGAKRPTSHLRAVLLPFQRIAASISRPRGDEAAEIFNLRAAEYSGGGAIVPAARLIVTRPSSMGCLKVSSTVRLNSGNSSRNRTP